MAAQKVTLPITGMTCANCAANIERALTKKTTGVVSASVNFATERLTAEYIPGVTSVDDMVLVIQQAGYGAILPDEIDDDTAVLIEPLSVGVRTALRRLPEAGQQALVVGSGMIGLATIAAQADLHLRISKEVSRGRTRVKLTRLEGEERVTALLAIRDFDEHEDSYLFFATRHGRVKRTALREYANIRTNGLRAVVINEGDDLLSVRLTHGENHVFMGTNRGMGIRFAETDARPMGRVTAGVRGIKLPADHEVIALAIVGEGMLLSATENGFGKRTSIDEYPVQRRGGKGKKATRVKDEDFIDQLFVANSHDTILCFSSRGKCYWLKVYELPQAGRTARGRPMVNLLPLEQGERINAVLPVREYTEDRFVFMATASGTVKKTPLIDFSRPRSSGIIAVDLRDDDQLIGVDITDGSQSIMLFTSAGKAIRFKESDVRAMGRTACGVRGVKLGRGQRVISLIIGDEGDVMTVTENGFGKRTAIGQFPIKGRGGMGVISIKTSERNGEQVGAVRVAEDDEIMLITDGGTLVRTRVSDVSQMGRDTQGVTMIRLAKDERLIGIERIEALEGENDDADESDTTTE